MKKVRKKEKGRNVISNRVKHKHRGSSLASCLFQALLLPSRSPPAPLPHGTKTQRAIRATHTHTHTHTHIHGGGFLSVHTCMFSLVFSLPLSRAPASPAPGVAAAAGAYALGARTTCPIPGKPSTVNARRPTSHFHQPVHSSARPSRLRLLRSRPPYSPYSPQAVAPCIELVVPPPACLASRCTATAKTREGKVESGGGKSGERRGG